MTTAPKILVVDDNIDNVELLVKRLRAAGYRTCEAYDGEQALEKVAAEDPDLVILDVMMPKLDGYGVCERLKTSDATRSIPVLMLTAKREVPDKIRGLDIGADDYITKPFNPQELMARVKSLLQRRFSEERRLTEERLDALGQMAEGVAHEVRNPMVAIGGFARRIRDKLPEDSPLRDYAERILQEVKRLESMVEEIVRFKTLMISPYQSVDLRQLADEVLDRYAGTLEEAGLRLERDYGEVGAIQGDPQNLRLALENLLQNAIEATPPGGTISVRLEDLGDRVRLVVADTGRGIPKDQIANVFDPFYTTKTAGAGMGLTMVHRIVTRHGGAVDIESQVGRGTAVHLVLPKRQPNGI
ncbi:MULTISPECIES: ATP-binding response regulator [Deferrisoma]